MGLSEARPRQPAGYRALPVLRRRLGAVARLTNQRDSPQGAITILP